MKQIVRRTFARRLAAVMKSLQSLPIRAKDAMLFVAFACYAGGAYAQSAPQGLNQVVGGICRLTTFMSGTVVFAILGLAIAGYGIAYATNSLRDGLMESGMRIAFGGAVAISSVAIVSFLFNQGVC